ncbi:MAG: radical SAM protein [Candidatus Omnitrophota bacterium]
MSIDVLLMKPYFKDIAISPLIGIGYISSILRQKGITVSIHDNTLLEYNTPQLVALFRETKPKILGLYAATPMIKEAERMARLAKSIDPEILTVLGGPHPSCTVDETLAFSDVVVVGEGEVTFPEIAQRFLGGSRDFSGVLGCAFNNAEGAVIRNPSRDFIQDLDALPFPDFDHMPVERYFKRGNTWGITQKAARNLPIMATRGCPSDCNFCQRFLGKQFRVRSPQNIVEELAYWKEKYQVSEFNFFDDNFTLNKKNVLEVCDLIHRRGLGITFRFPNGVREDCLDEEILDALKSVGCYHLDFGIESGTQKVLDLMRKGKKIEKIVEKVRLCKKAGFTLSSGFLFGTPGETLADMEETIRFALALPLDSAAFGLVVPFPGTRVRQEAIEKGYLIHSDYEHYNMGLTNVRPPIETPEWTGKDILQMTKKAYRRFFLRPGKMLKLLPSIANPVNIKRYIDSFLQSLG